MESRSSNPIRLCISSLSLEVYWLILAEISRYIVLLIHIGRPIVHGAYFAVEEHHVVGLGVSETQTILTVRLENVVVVVLCFRVVGILRIWFDKPTAHIYLPFVHQTIRYVTVERVYIVRVLRHLLGPPVVVLSVEYLRAQVEFTLAICLV